MELTWYGLSCFRLKSRDATVVIDPYGAGLGLPNLKLSADLVLVTHDHPGHANVGAVANARRVIDAPGEFEIAGVFVRGMTVHHDGSAGAERGRITAFSVQIDDVTVCHLGDIAHRLTDEQVETLGSVDVLLVPVGGGNALNAVQASEVAAQVSPRIVVPMHFGQEGLKRELESEERFVKEMGAVDLQPQPKLTLLGGGAPAEETRVVLLQRAGQ